VKNFSFDRFFQGR